MPDQAAPFDPLTLRRKDFSHFLAIPTRWMDNDLYGHVNNVTYYSYVDTVINEYLIRFGGLDIQKGEVIGITPETRCRFYASLAYPEVVEAGLRVARLGRTSVSYQVGLFKGGREEPAAFADFVHVFVERESQKPAAIPPAIRSALEKLHVV